MGKMHKNAANEDLSINISLSLLNDSKGEKLVQYLRRAKGVRNRSDRIFSANDTSPRKSFPVEVSTTSGIDTEENENEEPQQERGNKNFATIPDVCDMILTKNLESLTSNSTQRSKFNSRRSSTGLQKIVRLRELQKTVNKNAFNPIISSTPVQSIKRLLDENFTPVSNIREPENTFTLPKNPSSTDNTNSIITISDDRPSQSKSSTPNNSQHPSEPQTEPPIKGQIANCTQLQVENQKIEEPSKNVTIENKENECQIEPDKNSKNRSRKYTPSKIVSARRRNNSNIPATASSIPQPVIIIPITQNVTSPVKHSNENKSRGEENAKEISTNNEGRENVKQNNTHIVHNKDKSTKDGNMEDMCANELLITSDEDTDADVPREHPRAATARRMDIENVPETPPNTKVDNTVQVMPKANPLSLKRNRPIGHRVIKTLNISPQGEQSGILDLRCRRSSQGEECAVDLRVEEKRRESEVNQRRSRFTRLPSYLSCNPPADDSSNPTSTESENESDRGEIIHDNCNAVCDLPSVLNNVKTMNKVNPLQPRKITSAKKIELLKKSYLRTTNTLKPRRRMHSGRRKLYSGETSDNVNESHPSIESVRSDRRLTRRTFALLEKQGKLSNSSLLHAQNEKIDLSNSKNVTVIEANKSMERSTTHKITKESKKSTQQVTSVVNRSVHKESPDSGLDDNSMGENDANSDEECRIPPIPDLASIPESEPVTQIEKPTEQMPSKHTEDKNSKKKKTRKPYTRGPKKVTTKVAEEETISKEGTRKSKRTRQAPQNAMPPPLLNVWSQAALDRLNKQGSKELKTKNKNTKRKYTRRKNEVPSEGEAPEKVIENRINHSKGAQNEHQVDNALGAITGESLVNNKRQLKSQKTRMPSKSKKTAEELFDELKATNTQVHTDKTSDNQPFAMEIPSSYVNPDDKIRSVNRDREEEYPNEYHQSEIELDLHKSKMVPVKDGKNRKKGRKGRFTKAEKHATATETLVRVIPITKHSFDASTLQGEQVMTQEEKDPDAPKKDRVRPDVTKRTKETEKQTVPNITCQNEERSPNSLFSWLTTLASEREPEKLNETICKIRSVPDTITIATLRSLNFEETNGVGYAFYASAGENQHFGYVRFQSNSFKRASRAKKYDLKFLCLIGSVQLKCDGGPYHPISPGDLFTIHKGTLYELKNVSQHLAVLFFVRLV